MKKNPKAFSSENLRLKRIWTVSTISIYLLFVFMTAIDILSTGGHFQRVLLAAAMGLPLVAVIVGIFQFTSNPKFMSPIAGVITQLAFLTIGALRESMNSYFFLMLVIVGCFSFLRIFRQMWVFIDL